MRRAFKISGTSAHPRYQIDGAEVTPAFFMAEHYLEWEALPSSALITGSAAQLASLAATSCELGGHDASVTRYTANARYSRLVQAVKNSDALSTHAV